MKKLLNCKAILALAICLTMFAGLAITASANPVCQGHGEAAYVGTYDRNCSSGTCGGRIQKHYRYRCDTCKSVYHVCMNCGKVS